MPPNTHGRKKRLPRPAETLRTHYVDIGLRIFALLSVYVFFISLMRIEQTGWLPLYLYNGLLSVVLVGLALARRKLSTPFKAGIMAAITYLAGVAGVSAFGLVGSGFFYFVLSGLLLAIFFSRLAAYLSVLLSSCIMIAVGFAYSQGIMEFDFDASTYMTHISSWWTVIFGPFVAAGFLMYLVGDVRQKLLKSMSKVEYLRKDLDWHTQHDQVTRLPNMRILEKAFPEWVLRSGHRDCEICVLVLDLDDYKSVNDRFSHLEGDYILRELAGRFQAELETSDTIARLGGDEFVIVMRGIEDHTTIYELADRLLKAGRGPVQLVNGEQVYLGVSIGGFSFQSGEQISLNSAIYRADQQMAQAKANGKGCFCMEDNSPPTLNEADEPSDVDNNPEEGSSGNPT